MKQANTIVMILMALCLALTSPALAKDGDIEARGEIQALSASIITVGGIEFFLADDTEYEDLAGNRTDLSQFSVGDVVKVKGRPEGGILVAHEVEHEDESDVEEEMENRGKRKRKGRDRQIINGQDKRIRLRARLAAINSGETLAGGKVRRELRIRDDRGRDRFRIQVFVPIPSTVPALSSTAAASALTLTALLSQGGVPYAKCFLEFDETEVEDGVLQADYKVDLRDKVRGSQTRFRAKKGSCDVDLSTDGVQQGIPAVAKDDQVTVHEVTIANEKAFLGADF